MNIETIDGLPNVVIDNCEFDKKSNILFLEGHSDNKSDNCPLCGRATSKCRNYYTRTIQDLPMFGHTVILKLRLRKFQCFNPNCKQHEFVERISYAAKNSQITQRLEHVILETTLHQSGLSATKELQDQGIRIKDDTLYNILKKKR